MIVDNRAETNIGRWYQTSWGVVLLGAGSMAVLIAIIFSLLTVNYWWKITHGQGEALANVFNSDSISKNSAEMASRGELEGGTAPALGNPEANLVIVEFFDFKCPSSREEAGVLRQVAEKYSYKVKIIARNFPMESVHPGASKLAEIAACAKEEGRYWEMNKVLFDNFETLSADPTAEEVKKLADLANVNDTTLFNCYSRHAAAVEVNRDYALGYKYGVKGTPTFFVNGYMLPGAVNFEAWEKLIKSF